jgi:general stress protein 26
MWFEGAFYFGTDAKSRKARNLALSPNIAVHLESGDDAVILEGIAERVTDSGFLERFSDAYKVKYEYRPDLNDPVTATYMLVPRVVFAWRESNFPEAATRWVFPQA